MAKTDTPANPTTTITDDWMERVPEPTTSFADDVKKTGKPQPKSRTPEELAALIETSGGAAEPNTTLAKRAQDVAMKEPEKLAASTETTSGSESGSGSTGS